MSESLTSRELEVLRGMADGKSNAEIGRDLFVSEETIKTHARRLFKKLAARDRAHAVAIGYQSRLLGHVRVDDCPKHAVRLGVAQAWLDEWRPERDAAPGGSRFALLYDGLAERLTGPPS